MAKVLVTGGAGLLGRQVAAELAAGHEVTALDLTAAPGVLAGDVLDHATMSAALAGHEAVVHLAGIDIATETAERNYFHVNVMGTWNVLAAAEQAGVAKAVVCSSISAHGISDTAPVFAPEYLPLDEAHPCRPTHGYGLSKQVLENIARAFAARGRLQVVVIRPTFVVYPQLVTLVERSVRISDGGVAGTAAGGIAPGSLSPLRGWVRPDDAARGFRLAVERDTGDLECFTLASLDSYSPEPTIESIPRRFGRRPEIRDPHRFAADPRASAIDSGHARRVLGWQSTGDWPAWVAACG